MTVQPTENAVPNTSLTVPLNFFAIDLDRRILAIEMTASNVMFPLCLMFLTFFLSLGGSFNSFRIIADAVGTIVGVAYDNNVKTNRKGETILIRYAGDSFAYACVAQTHASMGAASSHSTRVESQLHRFCTYLSLTFPLSFQQMYSPHG